MLRVLPTPVRYPLVRALAAGVTAAVGACGDPAQPIDPLPGVQTEVRLLPGRVAPGEAVTLVAIATNTGRDTVYSSGGCGAGLGFAVTPPSGGAFDPSNVMSVCPVFDSNVLLPGETDTVSFRWTAPAALGAYRVQAGVRRTVGLRAVSPRDSLVVRPTPCPASAASVGVDGAPGLVLADSAAAADSAVQRRLTAIAGARWISGVRAARLAAPAESLFTVGRRVAFEVAPGRRLVFEGDRVSGGGASTLSWRGQLRGGPLGEANVLVGSYGLSASLYALGPGGAMYSVQPIGGGWVAVACVEPGAVPPD